MEDRTVFRNDKDRMLRRLEAIAERGPYYLPDITHQIQGEIRQTEQGRVRVLWFLATGMTIICSHGFIKKSQKTPDREKARALTTFENYRAARAANAIIVLED